MKYPWWALPLLVAGCAGSKAGPAAAPETGPAAAVGLIDAAGAPAGTVTLTQTGQGVVVRFRLQGMTPGTHGAHVHAAGRCEPPGFTSAGGHLNTTGRQHGHRNPAGWHLGDIGNLVVSAGGTVDTTIVVRGATLAPGPMSLYGPDGATAIVVHANPDDQVTDPAGNAGPRIRCGVLAR